MELIHSATRETLLEEQRRPPHQARRWRGLQDDGVRLTLWLLATMVAMTVPIVAGALLQRTWPLLAEYGPLALLRGQTWQPQSGHFGMLTFIAGSGAVTLVAMVLAVGPAVLCGINLAEYTSSRTRGALRPLLDVLVGIPSVVYGLWGILVVVPFIRELAGPWSHETLGAFWPLFAFTNPSGYSVLAAGVVLSIMVFPFIVSLTDEVLRAVPREMRETLLAMGATRWEATRCIVRRRGLAGILAAVVLGFSRAFGETLAVMMVVGNTPQLPVSIFDAAYPLPALIANNYGEMMSVPLYESALMGAALLLLLIVLVFNIGARLVIVCVVREV